MTPSVSSFAFTRGRGLRRAVYTVLEYVDGGDLLEYVTAKGARCP